MPHSFSRACKLIDVIGSRAPAVQRVITHIIDIPRQVRQAQRGAHGRIDASAAFPFGACEGAPHTRQRLLHGIVGIVVVAQYGVAAQTWHGQHFQQRPHVGKAAVKVHEIAGMHQQVVLQPIDKTTHPLDLRVLAPIPAAKMGVRQVQNAQSTVRQPALRMRQPDREPFQCHVHRLDPECVAERRTCGGHTCHQPRAGDPSRSHRLPRTDRGRGCCLHSSISLHSPHQATCLRH